MPGPLVGLDLSRSASLRTHQKGSPSGDRSILQVAIEVNPNLAEQGTS